MKDENVYNGEEIKTDKDMVNNKEIKNPDIKDNAGRDISIEDRLWALRNEMDKHHMDMYIVPTCDFHGSEYMGDYFKTREFISGFTGSAGIAVVTKNQALLWTDGRYFVQAANQLPPVYKLMKQGEPDTPTVLEFVRNFANEMDKCVVGFDGKCMFSSLAEKLEKISNVTIVSEYDLIGKIWNHRPDLSCEKVWILDEKYAGKSYGDKIKDVRLEMKEKKVDMLLITTLEDISWLLNLRGNDIECTPVFLGFAVVTGSQTVLYVQKKALNHQITNYLEKNNIDIREYNDIDQDIKSIRKCRIWIDASTANYQITKLVSNENYFYKAMLPTTKMKAVKNETEIANMKKAHLLDGIAMTKFVYWLKNNVGKEQMDEISLGEKLEYFRGMAESYIEPSFEPIVGYNDHGAIVHYSATKESNYQIENKGMVLIDSGGHYLEGTTDITRTISLGEVTDKMRQMYTLVLKGHLHLGNAVFKKGCSGVALDIHARKPLWDNGLDFNHGTGHGVGYLLSVHEPPNAIRYRILENQELNPTLEPGMITSNEPGLYLENKFGIRIENLILCKEKEKNEYGQFLNFETLTLCPYDKELIDVKLLSEEDIKLVNEYHKRIYDELAQYLTEDEKQWLLGQQIG